MIHCGDKIHGFCVERIVPVPELSAVLYQLVFEKNRARLVWLEREEEIKTFLIAFCTLPEDDTGVFHILEHSVLDGSVKYPVKGPIIELLKRSLQTDLNAMTFSDMTAYYCCSKNKKDFANLMAVYLDAVFHPLSVQNTASFRQEGWHYEIGEDGKLDVNGVVYNEMRDSSTSWKFLLDRELARNLFPGSHHAYVAGGVPEHIPELTYEQYQAAYERYYHPSNSWIWLDGKLDLAEVLAQLEPVLSEFQEREPEVVFQQRMPETVRETTVFYELPAEDKEENKAIFAREWVLGDWSDKEKTSAFCLLRDILFGSNEAPVPRALYEKNLCQNLYFQVNSASLYSTVRITVKNADPAKQTEIWSVIRNTLLELVEQGLNKDYLNACLDTYEFNWREQGSSEKTRGVVYALHMLESALYGGLPERDLSFRETFCDLREKINTGWFENLIREVLLDNPVWASCTLLPSSEIAQERKQNWEERMARLLAQWSPTQIHAIREQTQILQQRAEMEETEEKLALLPRLTLADIPAEETPTPNHISHYHGVTILHQPLITNGIRYLKLYFDCSDLSPDELLLLDFLSELYGNLATSRSAPMELQRKMDQYLGSIEITLDIHRKHRSRTSAQCYLSVEASFLEEREAEALEVIREILFDSSFQDLDRIAKRLQQRRRNKEAAIHRAGSGLALSLAERHLSVFHDLEDLTDGLRFLNWLKETDDCFEKDGAEICQKFTDQMRRILVQNRLTLSVTGSMSEQLLQSVLDLFPEGEAAIPYPYGSTGLNCWEAYENSAETSAFAMIYDLNQIPGFDPVKAMGSMQVAAHILSYEYLWNEIREKGGAYDAGITAFRDGTMHISVSRDPNPVHTLKTCIHIPDALRRFAEEESELDDYIISVIGESQSESDSRYDGLEADCDYLSSLDPAEESIERNQILHTGSRELLQLADFMEQALSSSACCLIGPGELISACVDVCPEKQMTIRPIVSACIREDTVEKSGKK